MRRDRFAAFFAVVVVSVVGGFAGCDSATEDPVIVLPETDGGDLDLGGADARVDGAGFDALPGDGPPPDLPACLDPCDDGEAATTGDRCVDDVCVGQALPAMLALVGDVPPLGGETRPAAEVVAVRVVDGQVVVEGTGARAPRAFYGLGDDGRLWATRPLDVVDTTAVLQWDAAAGRFVTWSHRAPLVPGANVVALDGDAVVLVGRDGIGGSEINGYGTVMHVAADGFATRLGVGAADADAFVGWDEGRLVARVLGAMPGEPWEPEDIDLEGIDPGAAPVVVGGYGFVPASEGLAVIDVADRRVAALEIGEAPRFAGYVGAGDRWAVVTAGDAVVDFGSWPPRIHRLASAWVDARVVAGAVVALDAAGAVWRSALGDEGPAPLDRLGVLAPGAALVAVTPDGSAVLARLGESWWLIRADGTPPVALPPVAATFAGFGRCACLLHGGRSGRCARSGGALGGVERRCLDRGADRRWWVRRCWCDMPSRRR
jgi:hypothetical protein